MRRRATSDGLWEGISNLDGVLLSSAIVLASCAGTLGAPEVEDAGADASLDGASTDAAAVDDDAPVDARAPTDTGRDAGPVDPCATARFCEPFDAYAETILADGQRFGPWRAALQPLGGAMDLSGAHTTSGRSALHVRIEAGATAGGRLFTEGAPPLLDAHPTHVYGRMMMYLEPNGSSVHWTFFGASGDAVASSPAAGRRATYLVSSLPRADVNTFSFVDGLEATPTDPFHDCWFQSMEPMPTARWTCVSFELDSEGRRLRLAVDGAAPILAVDDHGQGCVGDVVPDDAPWYGPAIDQLYVGAWSFHPMTAPLEVWIDDLIVDTEPVPCPVPPP